MLADARYSFIENVTAKCVVKGKSEEKLTVSDKIDIVVTNRFLALPIFILIMGSIFGLTSGRSEAFYPILLKSCSIISFLLRY
mgnify:CR=1 FL=1